MKTPSRDEERARWRSSIALTTLTGGGFLFACLSRFTASMRDGGEDVAELAFAVPNRDSFDESVVTLGHDHTSLGATAALPAARKLARVKCA